MNKVRFCIYILLFVFFSSPFWGAQLSFKSGNKADMPFLQDTVSIRDSSLTDSILIQTDSIPQDSIERNKNALDAPVDYVANDSIIFTMYNNWGYLYGDAKVNYQTLSINAEDIRISLDSSIVHAKYGIDSVGEEFGHPIFKDNNTEYEMKTVSYNFKSKKGYIRTVLTQQGEGYIVADKAKKNPDDSFFMCDGKYTTCDNPEHPHFYLMLTKAKVRPKKNVVTGPAYLVIEGLPLPLAIPFGFFPFTDKYSSGIIMPSYGDDMDRGFNLRNGGYYFAINDYIDLALTGEIYTKGSWGIAAKSTYRKRYKHNGGFDLQYMYTKYGDKEVPSSYSVAKDFKITWRHSQDAKANMYRTLSANVNYSTTTFNRYNQESLYGSNSTENTKSSTITLTQRFPDSPFSISANMSASQRAKDSTVSLTLPNFTISMSRIFPFKRKETAGEEKWYEKIQMSYTGDFRNSITTKDNLLFKSNLIKDWQNGMMHRIPVSATFNLFNYINITPSFNYNERWYTKSVTRGWNADTKTHVERDTSYSFYRSYDFNYSLSIQTKLYGFYEPLIKIGKIKTIRHVFTPSISFSGNPDFSDPKYGSFKSYWYVDQYGERKEYSYSPFQGQQFSPPSAGKNGSITFGFDNNLEMKVATDNDSTKIISLIDQLSINFSYNMMADVNKWSNISTNLRLKLSKNLMVNLNTTWDPYAYEYDQVRNTGTRTNKLRLEKYGTIARLVGTSYSISPSINQDTFKKWFGKGGKGKDTPPDDSPLNEGEDSDMEVDDTSRPRASLFAKKDDGSQYDSDGYLKNEIKWNLTFNYSMAYSWDMSNFNQKTNEYKGKITQNLGLSGSIQPTKNWNFNFTTSYDFDNKKFAYLNCSLSRNLHCWNISASFIPIGPYTSYYVSLRVNSSMLQDLKYEQRSRRSSYDPSWD